MAQTKERRALPKSFPTTVNTFVKIFLGKNPTDLTISDEQLGQLVLEHVKNNPETAKLFNVVSHTFSPEIQEQVDFIDKQMRDVKSRQAKREAKHKEWVATKYDRVDKKGNPIAPSEKLKKEMEEREAKLASGAESDRRAISSLAKAQHDVAYKEDIKVRAAERQNEKLEAERNKLIGTIAGAEQKKEDEKEKRKRAKAKLIGGQITDAVSNVAEGFNLGRALRGY